MSGVVELGRFQEIFLRALKGPLVDLLNLQSEAVNSFHMDRIPLQDSFLYRARFLGLRVAGLLVDEKGELIRERLEELNRLLSDHCYVLGPGRENDALIYGHIRNCLKSLLENKEIWVSIRRFSPPLCHKKAEEVIRETLWPEPVRSVQTVHIRKAVLASWLTRLRQTTGSCFATAPAILIQKNYPMKFFKDLYDLLSTGQLKRTLAGKQYSVPFSLNSGIGDLQKNVVGFEDAPGIAVALEEVGVTSWTRLEDLAPLSVEKYFRRVLLENVGLTEEDLQDEEHLSRIQMTPLLARQTAVYYQRPSERAQKVSEWKKKLAKACLTFRTLTECSLLRSWEYSIASLSDVKTEFARWNLYIGLGLHPDQKDGIGSFLYAQVNGRLQKCNSEIERLSKEYEQEVSAIQALETMIRGTTSDVRINQLKSELMAHHMSISSLIEMRDQLVAKADHLVGLFTSLVGQYDQKLQEAFQELFDPALFGEEAHLYDDSSAGFRLVYKHGRLDASQWTAIYTGEEYVNSLRDFFSNVENDLQVPSQLGREVVSEITTALIQFIQQPEFLASALERSKLNGKKSPWDYISGGTLQTLLGAYCNRDRPFTEAMITPHSVEELLRFFMQVNGKGPFLIHSPTHAFILYPELLSSQVGIKRTVQWNEEMQEHLAHRVSERLPENEKALFIHLYRQKMTSESKIQFRSNLIDALGPRIKFKEAIVDSVLFENSPLFSSSEAKEAVGQILRSLGSLETIKQLDGSFFGPNDLYLLTKMVLLSSKGSAMSSIDWDLKIAENMRRFDFCSRAALFGDTNWSQWFFGFVINPATNNLELWRLNRTAMQGFPMTDWKHWLDGKNTSIWSLLYAQSEYLEEFNHS